VGLLLTALLQSVAGMPAPEIQFFDIHNYLVAGWIGTAWGLAARALRQALRGIARMGRCAGMSL